MLESISPYALLKASKPRNTSGIITPYDLYSTAQSTAAPREQDPVRPPRLEPDPPAAQPAPPTPASAPVAPDLPVRRTHYIRDIETRHNAAMRRTQLRMGGFSQPSQRPET